jgi:hypothetical protein
MCTPTQLDHDLFRILLYRRNGKELLLEYDDQGFALPTILIPRYRRVAEQLAEAIRKEWKFQTVCLFPVGDRHFPVYAVELCDEVPTHSAHTLAKRDFCASHDFHTIELATRLFEQYTEDKTAGPFARIGWLRDVIGWVEANAAPFGLHLTGQFQQFNAGPTFSLVRFETDGPALWFKAVGEPSLREYSLTHKLANALPEFLPQLVAVQPDWNAWLTIEVEGHHLSEGSPLSDWQRVVSAFAQLQFATLGSALHLIDAGCKDARTSALQSYVRPFFDFVAELMDQQTKPTPGPLSRQELHTVVCVLEESLEHLAVGDIPNLLVHLDLNPNNVLLRKDRCVFLDWAEGAIGHPAFSFEYLREHWKKIHGADVAAERALLVAYTREWRSFFPSLAVEAAFEHTPLVAAFASAALQKPWQEQESCRAAMAPYLRSLTRRMKREAKALKQRRTLCV